MAVRESESWPRFPELFLNWLIGDARKLADGRALLGELACPIYHNVGAGWIP